MKKEVLATYDLLKSPRVVKMVTEDEDLHRGHRCRGLRKIWAISRPHPKSFQTESWAFALWVHDWMICNGDQRSLSLQTASKKPQIVSGLVTSYMLISVLWL